MGRLRDVNKIESSIRYGQNVAENMRRYGIEHDVGGASEVNRLNNEPPINKTRVLKLVFTR